ncbi:MAG: DUF1109 family protein [Proteobacteria bacterium]|nr:DUF1109 family protein [Pseudomonadota bacterium]
MKKIETNFLIYELAKKGITKNNLSFWKSIILAVSANFLTLNVLLLNVKLRQDIEQVVNTQEFYLPLFVMVIAAVLGSGLCLSLISPGKETKIFFRLSKIVFYLIWIGIMYTSFQQVYFNVQEGRGLLVPILGLETYLVSSVGFSLVLVYFMCKGYVISFLRLTILLCLASFSFANILNLFLYEQSYQQQNLLLVNVINIPVILFVYTGYKIILRIQEKSNGYDI